LQFVPTLTQACNQNQFRPNTILGDDVRVNWKSKQLTSRIEKSKTYNPSDKLDHFYCKTFYVFLHTIT